MAVELTKILKAAASCKSRTEAFFDVLHAATSDLLAHPEMGVFTELKKADDAFNLALSFACVFQGDDDRNDYRIEAQDGRALVTFKTNYDFQADDRDARNGITTRVATGGLVDYDIAAIFIRIAEIDPIFGERFARAIEPAREPERNWEPRKPKPVKTMPRKPLPV